MKWYEFIVYIMVAVVVLFFFILLYQDTQMKKHYNSLPAHTNPIVMEFDDGLQITIYETGRKEYWNWIKGERRLS